MITFPSPAVRSVGIVKTGRMYSCEDRCEVTCEYKGHNLMGEGECQGDNWLLCYSGHCWLVFSYYSIIVFSSSCRSITSASAPS